MIPVTKPFMPNREKLDQYLDGIYERKWLTNNGPLAQELTSRLEEYLGVENLLLVSNGTLALQIAYRVLGINEPVNGKPAEAITTPFTFIATASSLKWDGIQPVFADIDPETWCLASKNIEAQITQQTRAIVPVHVFGNACDVETIDSIAQKYNLKVIYDACHAFGVKYQGESLLKHGDAATLSFHATKLFHTGEGGAIIFKRKEDLERAKKLINFGISGPESIEELGINAKMNEFQAAMGLCVLDEMEANMAARYAVWDSYERELAGSVQLQKKSEDLYYNASYFPAVFECESVALQVAGLLKQNGILARRYFFPSLETVECLGRKDYQPVSHDIAGRILCLPIYAGIEEKAQKSVIDVIKLCLAKGRQR
ncbi:DegT/DnrJ/EryC1/StrS family aminotransferase [Marinobacter manganoxydans]|uniref:DegT/DnrJ/EryC1/StrS aminotransferase n=1 Tax=Marinobacter manganoxydans MnI7-9 TaxID=1094979 RepID=G6YP53_9GAMM|nr:DegT/DnrJ/EryC1/StrS family aminotransferase [Marinobacter manganoxydans]EHJ06115.1 DegT/DnrJ/EryC1/StrS aminotransferase [Marinobacter manganoxydans MnI7-9]